MGSCCSTEKLIETKNGLWIELRENTSKSPGGFGEILEAVAIGDYSRKDIFCKWLDIDKINQTYKIGEQEIEKLIKKEIECLKWTN